MCAIIIYAADIGSVKSNNFGWSRLVYGSDDFHSDISISNFVQYIIEDIEQGSKVSIGFECPLFLNLPDDPTYLTCARIGEGSRAWSAGAGSGALATGLTEVLWILDQIHKRVKTIINATFSLDEFNLENANLLIWEAFVTSTSKGGSHCKDAEIAVKTFSERYMTGNLKSDVSVENPYSLVGGAFLKSGISKDIGVLNEQCIVVKA